MTDVSQLSDSELLASLALPALRKRESSNRPGIQGPMTPYGRAQGQTQMLPATAEATAKRIGIAWRPELMTGKTREAADYQDALGRAYLQEGIEKTGSLDGGLRYYHGGPDKRLWGPKTDAYARAVLNDATGAQAAPQGPQGGVSGLTDAQLLAALGKPPKSPAPLAPIKVTSADMSRISPPPDTARDALRSFTSHAYSSLANTMGQLNPAEAPLRMMKQATGLGQTILDLAHGKPVVPTLAQANMRMASASSPSAVSGVAATGLAGQDYTPQTRAGRWSAALGTTLPGAVLPGSIPQRVANVVLPAMGSESAREATEALGGGQLAQQIAQFVGGAAGGYVAGVRLKAPAPAAKPMDLAQLKAAKQQAYEAVDNMGAAYSPEAAGTLKQGIRENMLAEELDPDLHPKVAATVRLVEKRIADGQPLTLSRLDKTRQLVRANIFDGGGTPEEKRLGSMILDNIDEFVAAAGPEQMVAGDGPRAAQAIATARDMNTRYRKVEGVLDAVGAADIQAAKSGSGGNIDNATRQQIARFLTKSRNLTPDERTALMRIIKPGIVHDALRGVGRMSPTNGAIMSTAGIAATAASGGPGAVMPLAGLASKLMADGMTKANVAKLLDLMAVGGSAESLPAARLPQVQMAPSPLTVKGAPVPMGLFGSMALTPAAIR